MLIFFVLFFFAKKLLLDKFMIIFLFFLKLFKGDSVKSIDIFLNFFIFGRLLLILLILFGANFSVFFLLKLMT